MKKINLFAVAFVAVLSQSVNANTAKDFRNTNIGSEDNTVSLIEKARPEAAPRGIFVLTKEARPEAAPRGARPEMAPRGARPEMAPRGARPEAAPRGAEIGKGMAWPMA